MRRLAVVIGIAAAILSGAASGNDGAETGDSGSDNTGAASTPEAVLAGLGRRGQQAGRQGSGHLGLRKDRNYGTNMADSVAEATEADPRLSGMPYRASAGAVVEKTPTTTAVCLGRWHPHRCVRPA